VKLPNPDDGDERIVLVVVAVFLTILALAPLALLLY
jgi:hypothetical protein